MRKLLITLLAIAAMLAALVFALKGPMEQTADAALKAYPVYSFVRTRDETLLRLRHQGLDGSNRLFHRSELSGPRDRLITTPNNDTLYSFAFLDLASGPVQLKLPALPDRYHSVAVMDARTDNLFVVGTRDGGEVREMELSFTDGKVEKLPPADGEATVRYHVSSPQVWLLVRTLVDGPADLPAARAAQQGFVLDEPEYSRRPPRDAAVLAVLPDPATLLRNANPVIAETPHLQHPDLAATGYGEGADAFEKLPVWRQWLWRLLLPRLFQRMNKGLAERARSTADGWSNTPPGIGTADASDLTRAGVALAGLGALPADEAVYWSAVVDAGGKELDGAKSYRLTIPAPVPAGAFWSLSLYERMPDGRLFYVDNPLDRFAVGNRTPGLVRHPDGSFTLAIQPTDPGEGANWFPTPKGSKFTLIFRAYLPEAPIRDGSWRLPAVEQMGTGAAKTGGS